MSRKSTFGKYEKMLDLSTPSVENRLKYKSAQAYNKAITKAKKYTTNLKNIDRYEASYNLSSWRSYVDRRKYNGALFLSLLWKIFSVLAPLIIVSILLNNDNEFKFDFFKFVNRFSELQFSLTNDLFKFVKNLDSLRMTNMSIDSSNNILQNIALSITNIITLLFELVSCIGFIVTFIIDLFANVFAFLGALVPSIG